MRAIEAGKHSVRIGWVRCMGAARQHRSHHAARAISHRAPYRERRDGRRLGGPRRAARPLRGRQGARLAPVRGRPCPAALRARGARRRRALVAPARGDDLRRRRARRPRVHGDGADARAARWPSACKEGRTIADDTALRWLREAAGALDAAHEQGVVHRDIKPGNLLLDDRDRLAIADFGIARLALEDQLTATGQVLGTASYISPEQAVGEPATRRLGPLRARRRGLRAADRLAAVRGRALRRPGARPRRGPAAARHRARPVAAARRRRRARPRAGQGPRATAGRAPARWSRRSTARWAARGPPTEPTRPIAAPPAERSGAAAVGAGRPRRARGAGRGRR